jgi:hypothetical protein
VEGRQVKPLNFRRYILQDAAITVGPATLRCAVHKYKHTLKVHRQHGGLSAMLAQLKLEIRKALSEIPC